MGGNDGEVGKIGVKLVYGARMRVADLGAHAAWDPRPHAGGADIDHHRRLERVDGLE